MCLQLLCFYSATHVPTQFICQEDATALIFRKSGSICPGANQTWHSCKLKATIICWHETKLGVITVVLSWWVRQGFEVVWGRFTLISLHLSTASIYFSSTRGSLTHRLHPRCDVLCFPTPQQQQDRWHRWEYGNYIRLETEEHVLNTSWSMKGKVCVFVMCSESFRQIDYQDK